MPIPFILGGLAALAGVAGVAKGVSGAKKMSNAKEIMERAQRRHRRNVARYKETEANAQKTLEDIGLLEMKTLQSFSNFQDLIEQIQGRPDFVGLQLSDEKASNYKPEKIREAAVGAQAILAGIESGGIVAGALGAYAVGGAAGAATAACGALGVAASTGTAISALSGAAATNAALAALGGGSLAVGGGGMALGTAVLGGATAGLGLLVGGWFLDSKGDDLMEQADDCVDEVDQAEREINKVCAYLRDLSATANRFMRAFLIVDTVYRQNLERLNMVINVEHKTRWSSFTEEEKLLTENLVRLVQLLFTMAKIKLVLKDSNDDPNPQVNESAVTKARWQALSCLQDMPGNDAKIHAAYQDLINEA